jgi:hypothetical protein
MRLLKEETMSMQRSKRSGWLRWVPAAVGVLVGALVLMTVGASAALAQAANAPCTATSGQFLAYLVVPDDQGVPQWVAPKSAIHLKRGESLVFGNPSARWVTVQANAAFTVFQEGDTIDIPAHSVVCRTVAKGATPKKPVTLSATYIEPTTTAGSMMAAPMTATGGTTAPAPQPTKPAGTIKPLAGPGMIVDN